MSHKLREDGSRNKSLILVSVFLVSVFLALSVSSGKIISTITKPDVLVDLSGDYLVSEILDRTSFDDKETFWVRKALENVFESEIYRQFVEDLAPKIRGFLASGGSISSLEVDISGIKRAFVEEYQSLTENVPNLTSAEKMVMPLADRLDLLSFVSRDTMEGIFSFYSRIEGTRLIFAFLGALGLLYLVILFKAKLSFFKCWGISLLGSLCLTLLFGPYAISHFLQFRGVLLVPGHILKLIDREIALSALWVLPLSAAFLFIGNRAKEKSLGDVPLTKRLLALGASFHWAIKSKIHRAKDKPYGKEKLPSLETPKGPKKLIPFFVEVFAFVVGVYIFFGSSSFLDSQVLFRELSFPSSIYTQNLDFSGQKAYSLAQELSSRVQRASMTVNGSRGSFENVFLEFQKLGLKPLLKEFEAKRLNPKDLYRSKQFWSLRPFDMVSFSKGYNVVAESLGKSQKTLVIGAPRGKTSRFGTGKSVALNEGILLELARVLSSQEHFYTYVFVSFDEEGEGLYGPKAFLQTCTHHPIVMAVLFDVAGEPKTYSLRFHGENQGFFGTPFWVYSSAYSLSVKRFGVNPEISLSQYTPSNPVYNFLWVRKTVLGGLLPFESAAFTSKGIPALGVELTGASSVDDIRLLGQFCEAEVKSLSPGAAFDGLAASRNYLPANNGKSIFSPSSFIGFTAWMIAAILISNLLPLKNLSRILKFFSQERFFILMAVMIAAISSYFIYIFGMNQVRGVPFFAVQSLWFAFTVGSTVALIYVRNLTGAPHDTLTAYRLFAQRAILALVFFFVAIFSDVFRAINLLWFPILVMSQFEMGKDESRVLAQISFFLWSFSIFVNSSRFFKPFLLDEPKGKDFCLLAAQMFIWVIVAFFMFGPTLAQRSNWDKALSQLPKSQ